MRDYAELIKPLRECGSRRNCLDCPYDNDTSYCIEPRITEAADVIEELLAAVPHWISVDERLPEKRNDGFGVIVSDDGFVTTGYRNSIGEWMDFDGNKLKSVAYWMPLSEPPKEETK